MSILAEDNIQTFHGKSKMEQIVEGSPSQNISIEHISAITAKLKALRMLWRGKIDLIADEAI